MNKIFKKSNVKYVVMTNIPYDENEKKIWLNSVDKSCLTNKHFRSALRIDLFMKREWQPIADILTNERFEPTKDGLREYLEKWIKIMSPEYLMVRLLFLNSLFILKYILILLKLNCEGISTSRF